MIDDALTASAPLLAQAVGFGFQFFAGFSLPFPFNIIFLPLTIIEWFLRAQISMTAVGVY